MSISSKIGIIRGLWGSPRITGRDRFPVDEKTGFAELLKELHAMATTGQACDSFYVYGQENYTLAKSYGLPVELMSADPWVPDRMSDVARAPKRPAGVWYGVNGFIHKLLIIQRALTEFDGVLWLDLRVRQVRSLDEGFWGQFYYWPCFRASLIRQRSPGYGAIWRYDDQEPIHRFSQVEQLELLSTHEECRYLPGGGCFFVNDSDMIDAAIGLAQYHPDWSDQQLLAAVLDMQHEKWIGARHWKRCYELKGYYYGRNRWYCDKEQTYLECGERADKALHRYRVLR